MAFSSLFTCHFTRPNHSLIHHTNSKSVGSYLITILAYIFSNITLVNCRLPRYWVVCFLFILNLRRDENVLFVVLYLFSQSSWCSTVLIDLNPHYEGVHLWTCDISTHLLCCRCSWTHHKVPDVQQCRGQMLGKNSATVAELISVFLN